MKQQRLLIGFLCIIGVAVFVWLLRPGGAPSPGGQTAPAAPVPSAPAPGTPAKISPAADPAPGDVPGTLVLPQPSATVPMPAVSPNTPIPPAPAAAPVPREKIEAEIEEVQLALRDFRTRLGGNPVGNNAEITKALLGDNLKQVKIPVPSGAQLNGDGELCDRWGTPYFFHQLSGTHMEIRSAGPDRKMWSTDDVQK